MMIRSETDRKAAIEALTNVQLPTILHLTPPKASDELTSRLHCAIRAVAKQATLSGEKLCEEEWKLIFVAAQYGQKVVRFNGRWIVIQKQTRNMSGPQKFDLTELVYAYGSEHGVIFDEE